MAIERAKQRSVEIAQNTGKKIKDWPATTVGSSIGVPIVLFVDNIGVRALGLIIFVGSHVLEAKDKKNNEKQTNN